MRPLPHRTNRIAKRCHNIANRRNSGRMPYAPTAAQFVGCLCIMYLLGVCEEMRQISYDTAPIPLFPLQVCKAFVYGISRAVAVFQFLAPLNHVAFELVVFLGCDLGKGFVKVVQRSHANADFFLFHNFGNGGLLPYNHGKVAADV